MIDAHARRRIIETCGFSPGQYVWEIGAGIGALTHAALSALSEEGRLCAFEVDHGFCTVLREIFGSHDSFILIEGDVLKKWKAVHDDLGAPDVVFGNLPYNIGAVFIASLAESGVLPKKMVFTVQKEAAQRMTAVPGDKMYSSLSLTVQLDYLIERAASIDRNCFFPVPDVESAVIVMRRKDAADGGTAFLSGNAERSIYFKLVKSVFASRRKTLKNNLAGSGLASAYGIDTLKNLFEKHHAAFGDRAETVAPEIYRDIAAELAGAAED